MNRFSRVTQYLLFFLVALIPFSIRHVFDTPWNYHTGAYSDFTSISLYISDFVLIALIAVVLFHRKHSVNLPKFWKYAALLSIAWLLLELFLQNKDLLPLQVYFSVRIALLIVFTATVTSLQVSRGKLAWLFTILGAIQSLIATIQFYAQKSIGLYLLGESHLDPEISGVAKIVSHGTKFIRGYGTFPHSNLLAAFLVGSTLFNLYLLTKTYQTPRGELSPRGEDWISRGTLRVILLHITLFLNVFGLFITFSRAGILALLVAVGVYSVIIYINKRVFDLFKVFLPILIAILASVAILWPYLATRTTFSDTATKERVFYNHIAKEIIIDKPIFGLGPGTSVLHMKQYSAEALESWEIQPIHNYYLISWAEWGIGTIPLIFIIVFPIIALFKRRNIKEWDLTILAIGTSFLVLFFFDHYHYTIWPTQLLLWLIVGLALNSCISHETSGQDKTTYDIASLQ